MALLQFKTKGEKVWLTETTYQIRFNIPKTLGARYCDMAAFRQHPKYKNYANSVFFPSVLKKAVEALYPKGYVTNENKTENTTIKDGFLTVISIEL